MILARDVIRFGWNALKGYRSRTLLMLLAMTIGVAAVLMLTALGEGARRYVRNEFASLGTNLVIILPGRSETAGVGMGTMTAVTPRDLTLDDVQALLRNSHISRIAPMNVGSAEVSWQGRKREVPVLGSTHELLEIRHWEMAPTPVCVIGAKVRNEIFGAHAALGQWVRLGENRYRVIGIMGSEGRSIGVDVQDVVIIPVASAQQLFNVASLFRVLIEAKTRAAIPKVIKFTEDTIQARHQGEKDVTVITQDAVLATFDRILGALTYSVGGIAAISLGVAGILIMNVMLIAVSQRTAEIGLLKALGASGRTIELLILIEALLLSTLGGIIGLAVGQLGAWALRVALPQMEAYPPNWAMFASMLVAIVTGALFSLLPARKAARLDPVMALSRR